MSAGNGVSPSLTLPRTADEAIGAAARRKVLSAADSLLNVDWNVFGSEFRGFCGEIDWFRDPLTGTRAPSGGYCFAIPYRAHAEQRHSKVLSEISRHQHLTLLAMAWRLSGDTRYAQRIAADLRSWWGANPVLTGVHWSSGLELGLRLISWTWARRLLDDWPETKCLFEQNRVFLIQLFHHQNYLSTFHSHGSSANNHLIGEAAGLFISSAAFPLFRQSRTWRDRAARILEQEIARQTDTQGLHRELATEYHGFCLELLLAASAEGDAANAPFSQSFNRRLRAMMDALASIADCKGRPPRQGDGDGGRGLQLGTPDFDRWTSLLSTGAVLFGAPKWWRRSPTDDPQTAFLSALATKRHDGLGERPQRPITVFGDAGLVILCDSAPARPELWCRCDHGPLGFLSIAAHGHADILAVELRHGGVDVFADPGTYSYETDTKWRHYFRSTLGHNTLELGGIDQARSGGAFLWLSQPSGCPERLQGLDGGPLALWAASHDGYRRALGAVHHRCVKLERGRARILIEDWIDAAQSQNCRLAFHLGPTLRCALAGNLALLEWDGDDGRYAARVLLPSTLAWTAYHGAHVGGWYSASFLQLSASTTLIGEGRLAPGVRLVTELTIAECYMSGVRHSELAK
jgi:hypothetical protein